MRALIIAITVSSGTKMPWSISFFASIPSSDPPAISERSMSPVERWTRSYLSMSFCDWVPLPAPGGPNKTIFNIGQWFRGLFLKAPCKGKANIQIIAFGSEDVRFSGPLLFHQLINIAQVASQTIVIESVAHNEFIAHLKAHVINGNIFSVGFGLMQQCSHPYLFRAHFFDLRVQAFERDPGVNNILQENNGAAPGILAQAHQLLHCTG